MKRIVLLVMSFVLTNADVYLHNPRGSNNRLDGSGREVTNDKRLFDSQDNNRGGYLVGNMYYYAGSVLPIEWTNQHSCKSENNNCNIVIQYMCGNDVRDGTIRGTIKENPIQCKFGNCQNDTQYGMHEDHIHFLKCKKRRQNSNLFTADQNLNGDDARFTRQNAQGTRRGYECPEERDYYPYWHPTQWKDIVVMTNDVDRCPYYKAESENVKGRGECFFSKETLLKYSTFRNFKIPNNKVECESYTFSVTGEKGRWIESNPHGIDPPDCIESTWSRDNHLGNGMGGQHNTYNWKVPLLRGKCVIRIRYNISTGDAFAKNEKLDFWDSDASDNGQNNGFNIDKMYGFASPEEAAARGYEYKGNPSVAIFPGVDLRHNLAINTAQFGRTFQDRSFVFTVRNGQWLNLASGAAIHNINVRGKRGNIVQVYPSVEYDFVPNTLYAKVGDYVHFQWTGSNSNPNNNAGQGRAGTDRSNIVVIGPEVYNEGSTFQWYKGLKRVGDWGRNYPGVISDNSFLGLSVWERMSLATLSNVQYGGDMCQLDDAGPYYSFGPKKIKEAGVFHYMSTRNNAFTNRCQKARIVVEQ